MSPGMDDSLGATQLDSTIREPHEAVTLATTEQVGRRQRERGSIRGLFLAHLRGLLFR